MGDIYKIKEIGYMARALDMLAARQGAIAANIANAETPGYKAARVGFEDDLKAALGEGVAMAETNPKHMPTGMRGVHGISPSFTRKPGGARLDGNTVNLDEEFTASAANAMDYELYITALDKHMKNIVSSLDEGGQKGR